jgi:hypothetical protein
MELRGVLSSPFATEKSLVTSLNQLRRRLLEKAIETPRRPRSAPSRSTPVLESVTLTLARVAPLEQGLPAGEILASGGRVAGSRQQVQWRRRALILATTKVEDFDRFLKVFSTKGAEKRKQHGSKGATVFRDPNEEDRVWVLFDWDSEGWQSFVSDPEVPPILQEAGHKGRPQAAALGGRYDS